jgi:hypothetical protein
MVDVVSKVGCDAIGGLEDVGKSYAWPSALSIPGIGNQYNGFWLVLAEAGLRSGNGSCGIVPLTSGTQNYCCMSTSTKYGRRKT